MSHEQHKLSNKSADEIALQVHRIGTKLADRAEAMEIPRSGKYGDTTLTENSYGDRYLKMTTGKDGEFYGHDLHVSGRGQSDKWRKTSVRWTETPEEERRKAAKNVYNDQRYKSVNVTPPREGRKSLRHPIRKSPDQPASFSTEHDGGYSSTTYEDISGVAKSLSKMRGRLSEEAIADAERHQKAA